MSYPRVLRLPQYFRNIQRLSEILRVLARHGFGDLIDRLGLSGYLEKSLRLIYPLRSPHLESSQDFAARIRLTCEELGPTFIKFAQLVATRPDIFPARLVIELKKLQDRVPPFASDEAAKIIQEELGQPVDALFESFERLPLAAASIAQVHKAVLRDGRQVIVKVRRPNLERIIETDIDILKGLASLIEEDIPESRNYNPSKLVEEFSRSLKLECDLRREGRNIQRFSAAFREETDFITPKVYTELSSERVLTEEFIDGFKIDEVKKLKEFGISAPALAGVLNRVVLRSIFEHGFFHADPHPGNILVTREGKVCLIDFGAMGRVDKSRLFQILQFILAILSKDLDGTLRVLKDSKLLTSTVDEAALKSQMSETIDHHLGLTLGHLDLSSLLTDVFDIVKRYGIKPPTDLLLVGKSLTTLEHIGSQLDPSFDPLQSIEPYLKKTYLSFLKDPVLYQNYLTEISHSYLKLASDFPRDLRSTLAGLASGSLVINTKRVEFEAEKKHQNRLLNRALQALFSVSLLSLGSLLYIFNVDRVSVIVAYIFFIIGTLFAALSFYSIRKTGGS
jgi:ubiquinone biosynthesis protein